MTKTTDTILSIISKALCIVLFPLFLPTVAMCLLCFNLMQDAHIVYRWVAIGGTFVFTCFIPFTLLLILKRQHRITDLNINKPEERMTPYLYTLVCFIVWCYFLWRILHMPALIVALAIASSMCIAINIIINIWWKISTHLTAFGCFVGSLIAVSASIGVYSNLTTSLLFLLALLLMYARIYLKAHTPWQTIAGLMLGLTTTLSTALFFI